MYPGVRRPYVHPFGMTGLWVSTVLTTAWILLGSWVAIFPDSLERLFGVGYDFKGTWSVSRFTFEYLTLGTLLAIVFVGTIGYFAAGSVRSQTVTTDLGGAAAEGVATQPAG
jgi:hypothetical protein